MSEALATLGYVNAFGRGVIRAQDALRGNGNPEAEFTFEPMFHLRAADGALGGHIYAVRDCYADFERLARRIADKCGVRAA